MQAKDGIPADQLPVTRWRKSQASNPSGCCVEVAELPGGAIAVRNSRDPSGPALVYTRAEIGAFLIGTKNGEFDDLYPGASASLPSGRSSGGLTGWRRGARDGGPKLQKAVRLPKWTRSAGSRGSLKGIGVSTRRSGHRTRDRCRGIP